MTTKLSELQFTGDAPMPKEIMTTEQKMKKIDLFNQELDRFTKLKDNATSPFDFAVHFKDITIISSAHLPTHVAASIKTILAEFAETERMKYIGKANEVINS